MAKLRKNDTPKPAPKPVVNYVSREYDQSKYRKKETKTSSLRNTTPKIPSQPARSGPRAGGNISLYSRLTGGGLNKPGR